MKIFMKPVAIAAIGLAAAFLLYGCPERVMLTVRVSPSGGGTVEVVPDAASYSAGSVVQLVATPADAWRFNRWEGVVADPDLSTTTITLERNETVTAVFEQILQDGFKLQADVTPASNLANITLNPPPDPESNFYRDGTIVTVSADTSCCPGGGTFVRWEGDVSDPNEPVTTVTMNGDKSLQAVVRPAGAPDFEVDVSALPEGAGTVDVTPNQSVFFAGEQATLQATPAAGYKFAFWIGEVSDIVNSTTTLTAHKNATIVAFFKPLEGFPEDPHAYLFGIPEGPLADQIAERFPNVTTISSAARGLVMPGSVIEAVFNDETDSAALKALFEAGFPIVLALVTPPQITMLEHIVGVDASGIELEPDEDFLAYFGIDLEPDGKVWRLVGHMPQPGDTEQLPEDFDAWRVQAISTLEAWVLRDNHRAEDFPGVDDVAEAAVKQTYADLVELAKADPLQVYYFLSFSDTGKSDAFALTTFPYSCHSLTGSGMDFFYIAQYGTFSGAGSYKYTEYDVINHAVRYMYEYRMWTQVTDLDVGDSRVTLYGPTPLTYTGADTVVTSGIQWSIGGSVGINSATGPSFDITTGVQVTNSYTISIPDVAVNMQVQGFNQPQWKYDIRRAYEDKKELRLPPLIAQGTLAPINQWIYVIQPTLRTTFPNGLPLTIGFEADESNDTLYCYFGPVNGQLYCSWNQSTSRRMTKTQSFTVPWPPATP